MRVILKENMVKNIISKTNNTINVENNTINVEKIRDIRD